MTERKDMEAALEAVLFVSSEPVPRPRLLEMFGEGERELAAEALEAVLGRYRSARDDGRGVMVDEAAGGLRLVTRPEVNDWLRRFFEVSSGKKLSMGALETLAIIAYRQPITGPEIQELRSVNPSGVIKTLLERRLVRIAGRKAVVGKPFLYTTTREFLIHFGLRSLKDLPPLEEFEEALAAEMADGSDALPGIDLEEQALRESAEIEDQQADAEEPAAPGSADTSAQLRLVAPAPDDEDEDEDEAEAEHDAEDEGAGDDAAAAGGAPDPEQAAEEAEAEPADQDEDALEAEDAPEADEPAAEPEMDDDPQDLDEESP